ncbi:putative yqey-like protein [Lyophyllum shimeji]|uniref:Altered inheritance of mitochondria protein 41 n=1 Tax=Lyophyllum shimeji TaxID=47721 RepID=A0A9P3UJR9_LYOSH|nr:putative yqey-like protein [Lyophyllum shimeji]
MVMSLPTLRGCLRPLINARQWRFYTTADTVDLRARLMDEVKAALKVDSSVLTCCVYSNYTGQRRGHVNNLETIVPSSTIANILRKAALRRNEAAAKFTEASRQELADKELRETEILSRFLPPLLSEAEIDHALRQVIGSLPADVDPKKALGRIFKEFYLKVDKSSVDTALVRQRADTLLAGK